MTQSDAVQAMIDAHYEYTRLTLDRSKFATKLREMASAKSERLEESAPHARAASPKNDAESLIQ
jgi:hypothetical protein